MKRQSLAVFHEVPKENTSAHSGSMRMLVHISLGLAVGLIMMGCSLTRPCKANIQTSPTARMDYFDEECIADSVADTVYYIALPTGRPISFYQRLVVDEARTWIGTPYIYARAEKDSGTDCSGMVMMVYDGALQVKIPRSSAMQAEVCMPLAPEEVEGGDLVFFATGRDSLQVSHVGIMLDDGVSFIHASSSRGVVISSLTAKYYRPKILMYGRVPALHALISLVGPQ